MLVGLLAAGVYLAVLGPRLLQRSPDAHFVHLANSLLHAQLGVVGNRPLGRNDWACFDSELGGACPAGAAARPQDRYRWYVSFPPFPAVLLAPLVALRGVEVADRAWWAFIAGLGPACLFLLLEALRRDHGSHGSQQLASGRSRRDSLLLAALFAVGTVYFFAAVQGTVWFAAHIVSVPLVALFVLFSLRARHPVAAGTMLALSFMTRPTTVFLAPYFLWEACAQFRSQPACVDEEPLHPSLRLVRWLRGVAWLPVLARVLWFSVPLVVVGLVAMWMNHARFEDPFEFGHSYLQIRWRDRIDRWGLFNYHYLAKNLAVMWASLPWLSASSPHVMVSRHGLALWVTTPALLWLFFPARRWHPRMIALACAAGPVVLLDLMYQNSGWVQFGYRFALDYMVLLFALLALGGRRFGPVFLVLGMFSVAVNAFGALTFDRDARFYDGDHTQQVLFQPD